MAGKIEDKAGMARMAEGRKSRKDKKIWLNMREEKRR